MSPDSNEFPENFRTAFGPPPAPFSENFIAIFSANSLPKLPFLMQKKLQWNFLDRKWPPPPFGNFPEIHSNPGTQASLIDVWWQRDHINFAQLPITNISLKEYLSHVIENIYDLMYIQAAKDFPERPNGGENHLRPSLCTWTPPPSLVKVSARGPQGLILLRSHV